MRYVEYEEMEKFLLEKVDDIDKRMEECTEDDLTYRSHLYGVKIGYLNALGYLIARQKIRI